MLSGGERYVRPARFHQYDLRVAGVRCRDISYPWLFLDHFRPDADLSCHYTSWLLYRRACSCSKREATDARHAELPEGSDAFAGEIRNGGHYCRFAETQRFLNRLPAADLKLLAGAK